MLLNMSITGTVVILFVLLARIVLKKAPKVFSYAIWSVVLFRLLCPVSITIDVSLLGMFDIPAVENTRHTTALEYIPYDVVYTSNREVWLPMSPVIRGEANEVLPPEHSVLDAGRLEGELSVGSMIWLLGIGTMAIYSMISYLRVRRKLIGAVKLRDNIYLTDGIGSPFVLGIIRPRIYLPSVLSKQEQRYIILHEQHHIRRCDHVIKVLAFIALCIHWFNPLVWVAFVLSSKDMEMSCDEAVVKKLGESIRTDYAASLLSLATGRRIIAGTPLAFGEGDTKSRIKNMLRWKKPKIWITIAAAVICIAVVVICAGNPAAISPQRDSSTSEENAGAGNQNEQSADTMEMTGEWVLDGTYTEKANNGLSLRGLFGTALGDYGASLQVNADGSIAYCIGVLTGKGFWKEDGDTGRYIAELVVAPDERDETLTFYEFRESPDGKQYLALEYDGYILYWTPSDTDGSSAARADLAKDVAYYLELAAGEDFRDMNPKKQNEILSEYRDLLDEYILIARESTDGKAAYIVGQFNGEQGQSPLKGMYGIELSAGEEEMFHFLYQEEELEIVEAVLDQNKTDFPPSVGYRIENSRVFWSSDGENVLIQPKDIKVLMDVPYNRYFHTPNGREYIADAVSRGIDVCGKTDTCLYVYLISEQFGEIAERIALTEAEAEAILAEERGNILDGFGFFATLHMDGETTSYSEYSGIPQTVLDLAVEKCGYRFADPGMITDTIREARLDCEWLEKPLYAKQEDLPRLREILKNADFSGMGGCGYLAKLSLTFTGGEKMTVFKGCDSCDSIVFGSHGGYDLGDKENIEFWEIFDLDPESKLPTDTP